MNNENNDVFQNALEKIRRDRKCIPLYSIGPTGPTDTYKSVSE